MKYSVHLIDSNGNGSYLSFKGKTSWKTKAIAIKHARDIQEAIDKGLNIWNTICVSVEDENGKIVWS